MIRTSSHHFHGVQLPPWQLPVQTLCTPRPAPPGRPGPCSAGQLTRAVSLPEQDVLRREPPVAPGTQRRLISSSYCSLKEDRAEEEEEEEEEEASDSSGRLDSSSSVEDRPQQVLKPCSKQEQSASRPRLRNSFLPSAELDEEEEDSDGDNLHRYLEDSSFVLHGNFNWTVSNGVRNSGSALEKKPFVLDTESQPGCLDSLPTRCLEVRESSTLFLDTTVQDLNKISCFNIGQPTCADSFPVNHTESASDSSCNSSDGILVNFCTIYNKSNNPATPQDLTGSPNPATPQDLTGSPNPATPQDLTGSPATPQDLTPTPLQPAHFHDGSVFLNLQPVRPRSPSDHLQHEVPSPQEESEVAEPSAPRWSPQALDSNCNLYSLEPWSSLELSDLTACLQGQLTLAMGTNQKYYKLVSCDLPSKSPSPAWPGLGRGWPEGLRGLGPVPSCDDVREGQEAGQMDRKGRGEQHDDRSRCSPARSGAGCCSTHLEDSPTCKTTTHTDYTPSPASASTGPCPIQASHSLGTTAAARSHDIKPAPTRPPAKHRERSGTEENGACSWAPPVVRYSKAQRPTSLPIQPFILLPQPKPQSQHLGSLLDQYISHRGSSSSQPGSLCKAKGNQLLTHLQPSPRDSYGRILLEAPSSSDSCSTCSPSPQLFSQRRPWGHSSRDQAVSPCRSHAAVHLTHTSRTPQTAQTQGPYSGTAQSDYMFKVTSNKPSPRSFITPQTQPSLLGETPASHYLIDLTPEPTLGSSHSTPPTLACTTQHPDLLASPSTTPQRDQKPSECRFPCSNLSESFSPTAPRSPSSRVGSLLPVAGPGWVHGGKKNQNQSEHCEPLMLLSDSPPTEFCLSPYEGSYESLSISHLQRRGLLRSVSMAMDLIMAHFGSSRDPDEKLRLGSSRRSPTIAGLVLEHLCPAIQNIVEDGLRHHTLDVLFGQQRNHSWRIVEASTQNRMRPFREGGATRVLHNLVSKIQQCPQLSSSCMKLRAFIMGLLNLRALEFWLSHLQGQNDVVTAYYHSWAFMTTTQRRSQPMFRELLLLLQPLSVLPFNLNLLPDPRHGEMCSDTSPVPPFSTLLMTSWPKLQAEIPRGTGRRNQQTGNSYQSDLHLPGLSQEPQSFTQQGGSRRHAEASPRSGPNPGWWIRQPVIVDGVIEEEDCTSAEKYSAWSHKYHETGLEGVLDGVETMTGPSRRSPAGPHIQVEGSSQGGLRWAKLFGAAVDPPGGAGGFRRSQYRRNTRPSQWLQLDRSTLGQLAQSVWAVRFGRTKTD